MHKKIDKNGEYCPYPGMTVVAAVQKSDAEFWQSVYDCLQQSPTIRQYYAPLPHTSYHMTAFILTNINMAKKNENWAEFIAKKIPPYKKLHHALSAQPLSPEISFGSLNEEYGIIMLEVDLPWKQTSAIQQLAELHKSEASIPFHITLAYQYKNIMAEDYPKITEELRKLTRIFEQKQNTTLDQPRLCYFVDMTRFTPWDGNTNPFVTPPPASSSLYRFHNTAEALVPSDNSVSTMPSLP